MSPIDFDAWLIGKLPSEALLHVDETGINIASKGHWLHCVSTPMFMLYQGHAPCVSTCRKHGVSATQALTLLFNDERPDFMKDDGG